jgi:CRISPR-associated protein Csm3
MSIIYNATEENDIVDDVSFLTEAMRLLQLDYIGGHGSRGYGKIAFRNLSAEEIVGEFEDSVLDEINSKLKDVKAYEL